MSGKPSNDDAKSQEELAAFERRLRAAMRRNYAPPGLKERVLAHSRAGKKIQRPHASPGWRWGLQRIAAAALLAVGLAGLGGGYAVHQRAEQRRGEQARDQVMAALRITNRTLIRVGDRVNDSQAMGDVQTIGGKH